MSDPKDTEAQAEAWLDAMAGHFGISGRCSDCVASLKALLEEQRELPPDFESDVMFVSMRERSERAEARIRELEAEVRNWREEARLYAENAKHWREKAALSPVSSPEPECSGPHTDAWDCPRHRGDLLKPAEPSPAPSEPESEADWHARVAVAEPAPQEKAGHPFFGGFFNGERCRFVVGTQRCGRPRSEHPEEPRG